MTVRVAMNGFGRIGRMVFRALAESGRDDIEVVAINDLGSAEDNAHMLRYDSVHGPLNMDVAVSGDSMTVGGRSIKVLAERDPSGLPWGDLGVDIVAECTGIFSDRDKRLALRACNTAEDTIATLHGYVHDGQQTGT